MKSRKNLMLSQSHLVAAIYSQPEALDFNTQGLEIYQRSLTANAKRALAVSFPTIQQLVGDDYFALIASDFLYDHPLSGGDWGDWGEHFPDWLANNFRLDEYPYLSDCAQLDWLCHQGERAENVSTNIESLSLLSQQDIYQLTLTFAAGTTILPSSFPVADIWNAHYTANHDATLADNAFTAAVQQIDLQQSQAVLVWRPQWKALVKAISTAEYQWLQRTLGGQSIGDALDAISQSEFKFETWLPKAVQTGLVHGISPITNHPK